MVQLYTLSDRSTVIADGATALYVNGHSLFTGMPILTWNDGFILKAEGPLAENERLIVHGTEGSYENGYGAERAPVIESVLEMDIHTALSHSNLYGVEATQ